METPKIVSDLLAWNLSVLWEASNTGLGVEQVLKKSLRNKRIEYKTLYS